MAAADNQQSNDSDTTEYNIKARQQDGKTHIELEIPTSHKTKDPGGEEQSKPQKEESKDDEESGFTIAGYKPKELLKAPIEPPDPSEVGKRSPISKDK